MAKFNVAGTALGSQGKHRLDRGSKEVRLTTHYGN